MEGYRRDPLRRAGAALVLAALALRILAAALPEAYRFLAAAATECAVQEAMLRLELGQVPDSIRQAASLAASAAQEPESAETEAAEEADMEEGETEDAAEASGNDASEAESAQAASAQEPAQSAQASPAAESLRFTTEEAEQLTIDNETEYAVDIETLLTQELELDFSGDSPKILILHTHTSEAYTPSEGWEYEESDELRTLDEGCNMLRVGDEIAEVLEAAGIAVLHDRTFHDYPEYSGAYARSLDTAEAYLAEYPDLQMVLDVHRDASENVDGTLAGPTVTVGGQASAQVMLVVGTDAGGLEHPLWRNNLSFALKLQALAERDAPGVCRDLNLRQERFNQHAAPASVLVEVGSAGNTMDEALLAARLFAAALAQLVGSMQ